MRSITNPTFAGLLRSAVEEPGTLSSAYRQFHSYSLGNTLDVVEVPFDHTDGNTMGYGRDAPSPSIR